MLQFSNIANQSTALVSVSQSGECLSQPLDQSQGLLLATSVRASLSHIESLSSLFYTSWSHMVYCSVTRTMSSVPLSGIWCLRSRSKTLQLMFCIYIVCNVISYCLWTLQFISTCFLFFHLLVSCISRTFCAICDPGFYFLRISFMPEIHFLCISFSCHI